MTFTKQDIVDKAREYMDTPFVHQGRLKGVGVDCAGLCISTLREFGVQVADVPTYKRVPDGQLFATTVAKNLKMKRFADVEVGDFLVFAFEKEPQHIAIVTQINPLIIIHALEKSGKVVEHTAGKFWEDRVRGCFEYRQKEE